ncbi:hypothetical protein GCM10010433_48680 [Streptomyces pulveraceus]|uniref:Glycosyltransferase n=1 Tax=Streptomyces pulveraceus TaxID=68258 RepID=A0ABW1GME3_9ACTN
MPRFSVVVPVRRARGQLRECLESVLGQSFTGIEVIGSDDGAPDGSGPLFDEFAARDCRVQAIHLPPGAGADGRRDAGTERALGGTASSSWRAAPSSCRTPWRPSPTGSPRSAGASASGPDSAPSCTRAAFRARFCPYGDGRAAERVVRQVLLGEADPVAGRA